MDNWKELPINTRYKVSRYGDVLGQKGTILKPGTDTNGYKFVNIYDNNKAFHLSIHRAVALTYIPNPNNYPQINHIDLDKSNNHVDNLEWCTNKQNFDHNISKPVLMLDIETGEVVKEFKAVRDVNKYFNTHAHQSVSKCCNNVPYYKTAYGYKWKFKEE